MLVLNLDPIIWSKMLIIEIWSKFQSKSLFKKCCRKSGLSKNWVQEFNVKFQFNFGKKNPKINSEKFSIKFGPNILYQIWSKFESKNLVKILILKFDPKMVLYLGQSWLKSVLKSIRQLLEF